MITVHILQIIIGLISAYTIEYTLTKGKPTIFGFSTCLIGWFAGSYIYQSWIK